MKRKEGILRAAAAVLALLLLLLSLAGCTTKLKLKKTKIVDPKTGSEYVYTPGKYLPKSVSEDVYAVFELNKVKVNYYSIEGLAPEEWLVSEVGDVIYAGSESLPDLTGFEPSRLHISYNTDVLFALALIEDSETISKVIDRYTTGEKLESSYLEANTYRLLFESEKYPAIYYMLYLTVTPSGFFINDRTEGYMIEATDLFSGYVDPYSYSED